MNFDQLIQYKALHRQFIASGPTADFVLASATEEVKKAHFRNVCAVIPTEVFEDLEHACTVLGMTKRIFIEHALMDALTKAAPLIQQTESFFVQGHSDAQEVA